MTDNDTRGRFPIEAKWPLGGIVSRPMGERHYDVQAYTGFPSSTVKEGQWTRGSIAHFAAPTFRPSARNLYMYDPTNPLDWAGSNGAEQ